MRLRKEAVVGDSSAVKDLIGCLAENAEYNKWPGEIDLGGTIEEMLEGYLNDACSTSPEIKNGLKIFDVRRITSAQKILDTLSSISVQWVIGSGSSKSPNGWFINTGTVNKLLGQPREKQSEILPATLRLNSLGYTIAEYTGTLRIGLKFRKDRQNFGVSMLLKMELKFARADDFHTSIDTYTTDRIKDMDWNSRMLEFTRITHAPFTSLFCAGKDLPLCRMEGDVIDPKRLASICMVAKDGELMTQDASIQGSPKETAAFFEKNEAYTKVEIEGLKVWDGVRGAVHQPRLLLTMREEASLIPKADAFLSTEYDIQVFVCERAGKILYKQLAKLSVKRIKNDFYGTIYGVERLIKAEKPAGLDLNRLERDNQKVQDIHALFDPSIHRSADIPMKVKDSESLAQNAMSFLKETVKTALSEKDYPDFLFTLYLDDDQVPFGGTYALMGNPSWKEFENELSAFDYSSGDEFQFKLAIKAHLKQDGTKETVFEYRGTLDAMPKSKTRLGLTATLNAVEAPQSADRTHIKKAPVNPYSDLDYDEPVGKASRKFLA